jgi:hypothetical protein
MDPATADPTVGFPTDRIPFEYVNAEFAKEPVAPVTVRIAPTVPVEP